MDNVAITVVVPPFSENASGDALNVTDGAVSSSSIVISNFCVPLSVPFVTLAISTAKGLFPSYVLLSTPVIVNVSDRLPAGITIASDFL